MWKWILAAAAVALAPMAANAAASPEAVVLAKRVMTANGDADAARAAVPQLTRTLAKGFANGAAEAGTPFNQKVLDQAVKAQIKAYSPRFVNADADAYAEVYSAEELRQYIAWYKTREARRGKLPAPLVAKTSTLGEHRAVSGAALRPKLAGDLFTAYCARAGCTDQTRKLIADYGHL